MEISTQSVTLPWFSDQWHSWGQMRLQNQFPSALLLTGASGIGKHKLAQQLAALLVCDKPSNQACGECKSCKLLAADTHPDLMSVVPEEGSKSIKIDQVRSLSEFIQGKPQVGHRLVAIVNPAESMNLYSANAILKTLEEPPAGTVIILVTHQASLLLPTIRSRCQIIQLPTPKRTESQAWLSGQADLAPDAAADLLEMAGGQPFTALTWYESKLANEHSEVREDWVRFHEGKDDAFSVAAKWAKKDLEWVMNWLGIWLRSLLANKVGADVVDPTLASIVEKLSEEQLWQLYQSLLEAKKSVVEQRNLNAQLLLENWLLLNKKRINY